jgi:hypothetical protein
MWKLDQQNYEENEIDIMRRH